MQEFFWLMVSLNRQEKGTGNKSALDEIWEVYGFPAKAIVTMGEVIEYLYNSPWGPEREIIINDDLKKALDKYYSMYGAE